MIVSPSLIIIPHKVQVDYCLLYSLALTVGFDRQTLELEEGHTAEICVMLLQPDAIQLFVDLQLLVDLQGSATGMEY